MLNNKNFWNIFYKKNNINKNSNFAAFVKNNTSNNHNIIDIGCGTGRDSFYFAKYFKNVHALDKSNVVIKLNKIRAKKGNLNIKFLQKDIASKKFILKKKFTNLYARFFLHTLNYKEEIIFFKNLKKISKKNFSLFLEFRTIKDKLMKRGKVISKNERFYGHYRRFIDIKNFKEIIKKNGFKITYFKQGKNYSIYKKQNPYLARFILK
jgi:tellurite methyltransferase